MKIEYVVSNEMKSTGYKDDRGNDLYSTDLMIIDGDRTHEGKPFVLDDWQATYPILDKEYEIDQQVDCAEFIVSKLKKYIQSFQLRVEQLAILEKVGIYKKSGINFELCLEDQARLDEISLQLSDLEIEFITVRCALAFHNKDFNNVDINWIAENMVNDGHYVMGREYLIERAEQLSI